MVTRTGRVSGNRWGVVITAALLFLVLTLASCGGQTPAPPTPTPTTPPPDDGNIQVYVYDAVTHSSLNGVVVRVTNSSLVDGIDHRQLVLPSCEQGRFLVVSAPDYETRFTACNGSDIYYFALNRINAEDNANYLWSSAYSECGRCHARQLDEGYNEVAEWEQTGHARVFADPYFQSLYRGTNVNGRPTTPTENYGPGFKLDKPQEAGNCAYCHAPTTILASQEPTDLTTYYPRPAGVGGEGVTCDVCHKVSGIKLDGDYPLADKPGVLSLEFLRLSNSFIVGPFSNILLAVGNESQRHEVSSCEPILSQSEFCAACHYGKFNDMVIYNSYGEWKESVYGRNPRNAAHKTCQDCHMSHMDVKNVTTPLSLRSACFETAEEYQDFDHNLMDVGPDEAGNVVPRMIQNAASLKVELKHESDSPTDLQVHIEVENTKAGHKFPTDSPLRHLILVVSATDQFGSPLAQVEGERIPDWAGTDNNFMNSSGVRGYAGQPGRIFANLLVDETTNLSPAASYWNNTNYVTAEEGKTSDTRLAPRDPQKSSYSFAVPDLGEIHITVKLIYRYAFFELMNQKGWARPDVLVASVECSMFQEPTHEMECK